MQGPSHPHRQPRPDNNAARIVVAVAFGLGALIAAASAVNAWDDAQGVGAALLGLSNHYAAEALIFAVGAVVCGVISALCVYTAVRDHNPHRPLSPDCCDVCRLTVGRARLHWDGTRRVCDRCYAWGQR